MEIEAKFALPDPQVARRLKQVRRLAGFVLGQKSVKRMIDTYLDTKSRALYSAGYACRRRRQGSGPDLLTVKQFEKTEQSPSFGGTDQAIHRREEFETSLPTGRGRLRLVSVQSWPEGPLRDRVRQIVGKQRLAPWFTLRQRRAVRPLLRGDQVIAEVSVDEVKLYAGKATQTFSELEIELTPAGDEADLRAIADHLITEWGLAPELQSKFERALGLADVGKPVNLARPAVTAATRAAGLDADDSMAEAARKTLLFHFNQMLNHEPGTRAGEDLEELHDMRVATRRMRAALRVFEPYLDAPAYQSFGKTLRRTGRTLGTVRDLDVFWEKTQHYLDTLPEGRRTELDPLLTMWQSAHEKARRDLLAFLDGEAYAHFKAEFGQFLQTPGAGAAPVLSADGEPLPHRVRQVLPAVLFQHYAAVSAYAEWLNGADVPLTRYHQLRIAAKGLRYTLEFFREVLPPAGDALIKCVKRLQEHLGNLQDAVVTCGLLRDFLMWGSWGHAGGGRRKAATVIVAPGVATYLSVRQTELGGLVESFPGVWAQVIGPDFKRQLLEAVATL